MRTLFVSKAGAALSALALIGSACATALPASAHAAPAVVASASQTTGDCGSIQFGATASDAATVHTAATCLQHAFASCSPSQLSVTWDNATERVDRVLSVSQGDDGSCQIVDQVTHTAKATGLDSSDAFTCGSIAPDPNGLTIRRCGTDGDVVLDAPAGS